MTLAAAALAAASTSAALAAEAWRIEPHDGFDRLVIPAGEEPTGRLPVRPAVPLLRRGDGSYRLVLPAPLASLAGTPRGLASFVTERAAEGGVSAIDLAPALGTYFRYRSTVGGFALDVVHGLPLSSPPPAAPASTGPLPPRIANAGLLFSASRLAALRLGDELILIMPIQAELDPATIPPARVLAVAAGHQDRHRLLRLRLRPDTRVEVAHEGQRRWRLGFSTDAAAAPAHAHFAAEGRSLLVDADAGALEFATLNLPEFGAVAVLLAEGDWAVAPARSPYLDVLDALVGGIVVARTDSLAIERRPGGVAVNGISRRSGG